MEDASELSEDGILATLQLPRRNEPQHVSRRTTTATTTQMITKESREARRARLASTHPYQGKPLRSPEMLLSIPSVSRQDTPIHGGHTLTPLATSRQSTPTPLSINESTSKLSAPRLMTSSSTNHTGDEKKLTPHYVNSPGSNSVMEKPLRLSTPPVVQIPDREFSIQERNPQSNRHSPSTPSTKFRPSQISVDDEAEETAVPHSDKHSIRSPQGEMLGETLLPRWNGGQDVVRHDATSSADDMFTLRVRESSSSPHADICSMSSSHSDKSLVSKISHRSTSRRTSTAKQHGRRRSAEGDVHRGDTTNSAHSEYEIERPRVVTPPIAILQTSRMTTSEEDDEVSDASSVVSRGVKSGGPCGHHPALDTTSKSSTRDIYSSKSQHRRRDSKGRSSSCSHRSSTSSSSGHDTKHSHHAVSLDRESPRETTEGATFAKTDASAVLSEMESRIRQEGQRLELKLDSMLREYFQHRVQSPVASNAATNGNPHSTVSPLPSDQQRDQVELIMKRADMIYRIEELTKYGGKRTPGLDVNTADTRVLELEQWRMKMSMDDQSTQENCNNLILAGAHIVENTCKAFDIHGVETNNLHAETEAAIRDGKFRSCVKYYTDSTKGSAFHSNPMYQFMATFGAIALKNHVRNKQQDIAGARQGQRTRQSHSPRASSTGGGYAGGPEQDSVAAEERHAQREASLAADSRRLKAELMRREEELRIQSEQLKKDKKEHQDRIRRDYDLETLDTHYTSRKLETAPLPLPRTRPYHAEKNTEQDTPRAETVSPPITGTSYPVYTRLPERMSDGLHAQVPEVVVLTRSSRSGESEIYEPTQHFPSSSSTTTTTTRPTFIIDRTVSHVFKMDIPPENKAASMLRSTALPMLKLNAQQKKNKSEYANGVAKLTLLADDDEMD